MRAKFSADNLLNRLRRGVTIVEVVVAMTVVVLLSGVGIGACYVALNIQTNAVHTELACNVSEEFISAFNGAANSSDFTADFKKRISFALDCGEKLTSATDEEGNTTTYTYAGSGITVTAEITEVGGVRELTVTGHVNKLSKAVYTRTVSAALPVSESANEENSNQAEEQAQGGGA